MSEKEIKAIYRNIDMKGTGERIKRLMVEHGYTIDELMCITGISTKQAVYKWFRGDSIPSLEVLLVLSEIFNVNINDLIVSDGNDETVEYDYDRGNDQISMVKEETVEWITKLYMVA